MTHFRLARALPKRLAQKGGVKRLVQNGLVQTARVQKGFVNRRAPAHGDSR